jgi:hypothetical protein
MILRFCKLFIGTQRSLVSGIEIILTFLSGTHRRMQNSFQHGSDIDKSAYLHIHRNIIHQHPSGLGPERPVEH